MKKFIARSLTFSGLLLLSTTQASAAETLSGERILNLFTECAVTFAVGDAEGSPYVTGNFGFSFSSPEQLSYGTKLVTSNDRLEVSSPGNSMTIPRKLTLQGLAVGDGRFVISGLAEYGDARNFLNQPVAYAYSTVKLSSIVLDVKQVNYDILELTGGISTQSGPGFTTPVEWSLTVAGYEFYDMFGRPDAKRCRTLR